MATLAEIVHPLDNRATTEDGLTFDIVFGEFNGAQGKLVFTEADAELPEADLREKARLDYDKLREDTFAANGWTPNNLGQG